MAASDTLPDKLVVKNRDQWTQYWLRSYGNRLSVNNPNADVSQATAPGSDAWLDAKAMADCLAVMSANAQTIAGTALIANMTEGQLIVKGDALGVPWPQATGAAGYVLAQTSSNGGEIRPGDVCTNLLTRKRYQCAAPSSATYHTNDPVPVIGVDTGPGSNADAGTLLTWDSPRSGVFASCTVQAQTDGSGLSGGRDKSTIEEYRALVAYAQANESASGNEAAAIKWAQDSLHHGVPVEKAFYYPAIYGPGNNALVFTVAPTATNGSRVPNSTQIAQVLAYVKSQMPGDDGIIACALNPVTPAIIGRIEWGNGAIWADAVPWPNFIASNKWLVTAVVDSTHFTIGLESSGGYSSAQQPSVGKTIALFNKTTGVFVKKTILSFTGTGPWVITCDTSSGLSDTTYTPLIGNTMVSPWSDSLATVATTIAKYVSGMGPGEQSTALGDGRKRLRVPRPTTKSWPITITSKLESDVTLLTDVNSFSLTTGLGYTVSVGVPAAYSNLAANPNIAIYSL